MPGTFNVVEDVVDAFSQTVGLTHQSPAPCVGTLHAAMRAGEEGGTPCRSI